MGWRFVKGIIVIYLTGIKMKRATFSLCATRGQCRIKTLLKSPFVLLSRTVPPVLTNHYGTTRNARFFFFLKKEGLNQQSALI